MGCSAGVLPDSILTRMPARQSPKFSPEEKFMRRVLALTFASLLCAGAATAQKQTPAPAPGASVVNRSGAPEDVERIIRAFTQKEAEFRKALNEYGFRRDAVIQTIAWGGQVSGEYNRVSSFVFDDTGK